MDVDLKAVNREILLSFWKIHILHHAGEHPIIGHWMLQELRSHGYDVSPGMLYPLLARLTAYGWLDCEVTGKGARAVKAYRLTAAGAAVLAVVNTQMRELIGETGSKHGQPQSRKEM